MAYLLFVALLSCLLVVACGGGGGDVTTDRASFNASASAGDFIRLELNFRAGSYSYENLTTGRIEFGTFSEDVTTSELSFIATSSSGGGGGRVSELITGFVAKELCITLLANNTGAGKDTTSMIFGVPERAHNPRDIISAVPSGSTSEYLLMQFRTNEGGFEIGYADLEANQAVLDTADLDHDGNVIETITGAPMFVETYSSVYGVADPIVPGQPSLIFSYELVNPSEPVVNQVPFVEAAPDASHLLLRMWETPGGLDEVVEHKLFFNQQLDKVIIDSPTGNAIMLERPTTSNWSPNYEGTYYLVEYTGQGTKLAVDDTLGSTDTLVVVIDNDGAGNGRLSVVGDPGTQNITLSSFATLQSSGLLGEVVSPWSGADLNGVFGFTVAGSGLDLGRETFLVFSNDVLFFVSAELTGPRETNAGDLYGWPDSYVYSYGGGAKIR